MPRSTTLSGTTFQVSPPWIWVTLTTAESVAATRRLTMVCRALTSCAEIITGSILVSGIAPWHPCR